MHQSIENTAELAKLERDVARWRQRRKVSCPMPAPLWGRAAELAQELGVGRVARVLGLNQTTLKHRVQASERSGDACLATFVELLPPVPRRADATPGGIGECALEVDSIDGSRLRVMLKGLSMESLATVLRHFARGSS